MRRKNEKQKHLEENLEIYFCFFSDIQEFYELTLLDESKTVQQKTAETLLIASKWEHENSIKLTDVSDKENIKFP